MTNPFTLTFGEKPELFIERYKERDLIKNDFSNGKPNSRIYMLTGLRGSGKTVLMTSIAKELEKNNYFTIELNISSKSLVEDFASYLYSNKEFYNLFVELNINLSVFGIGLTLGKEKQNLTPQIVIEQMLEKYKESNKRILITIDECVNNRALREFTSLFQILIRKEYPIYLIMTGLYKNIEEIQNNKNLTFLYRAERIYLNNLDKVQIFNKYNEVFNDNVLSKEMTNLTNGYPYAFQTLGYLMFNSKNKEIKEIYDEYFYRLGEYSYRKIYDELSVFERKIVEVVSDNKNTSTSNVAKILNKDLNFISNYKKILAKKGIIEDKYGIFVFTLPLFDEYIKTIKEIY